MKMKQSAEKLVNDLENKKADLELMNAALQVEKTSMQSKIQIMHDEHRGLVNQVSELENVLMVRKSEVSDLEIAVALQKEQAEKYQSVEANIQDKINCLQQLQSRIFKLGFELLYKMGWKKEKERYSEEELLCAIEKQSEEARTIKQKVSDIANRIFMGLKLQSDRKAKYESSDLEGRWTIIEDELQHKVTELNKQRAIVNEQKMSFSPSSAAKFILGVMKRKYNAAGRSEMTAAISVLERQVENGMVALDRQYYNDIYNRHLARTTEYLHPADELPELQKTRHKDWQFGD